MDASAARRARRPHLAAQFAGPGSGRDLQLPTTASGAQFYSSNVLDGNLPAPGGGFDQSGHGTCLAPQYFPDGHNRLAEPGVVSPVLRHSERWQSVTPCVWAGGSGHAGSRQ